jgi:tetratricopeptide (TPR) repeat protein
LARVALVSALREGGRIDDAIHQAHEVLVRRASDPNALAELALSHLEQGEIDTAELLSQEALKAKPESAVAQRTAGLIALERGDDAVAFRHFARASGIDPSDATARLNMGTVLLQAGVYKQAGEHFKAVLEVKPNDAAATLGLAAATRGLGSRDNPAPFREVERILKSFLDEHPRNASALYNLAVLYSDYLQQPAQAKVLYERFLSEAPGSHPAREEASKALAALAATKQ